MIPYNKVKFVPFNLNLENIMTAQTESKTKETVKKEVKKTVTVPTTRRYAIIGGVVVTLEEAKEYDLK